MLSALTSQPTIRPMTVPSGKPAAADGPQNPVDSLPDLSTIEARVQENAPAAEAKEVKTGPSGTSKAILAATGLATAAVSLFGAGAAQAQTRHGGGYNQSHGYNNGYNHRHHNNRNNNAGAIIGGAILGAIIGGAIANQAPPPVYYPPAPQYPQYPQYPQQVQRPFYDNYNRLICPNGQGGWYVSADHYNCRAY